MDAVASVATSSSVSLGPALAKGLEPLAAALRRKGSRLVCYAAENDHDAVESYAKTDVPFRLVPLLVDRVCTGRELTQSEKGYVVDTTTEPWRGEIVVMRGEDDVDDGGAFPFGGEGVYRPPSAAAAQFLHRRQDTNRERDPYHASVFSHWHRRSRRPTRVYRKAITSS